jgi:methyl-accepting chemotaxis protein
MPSDLDLAQQLKSVMAKIAAKTASSTVATTTIESGTATSNSADSTDGKTVDVILDAATVVTGEDDSQAVTLPTNVEVKTGDTVQVTCTAQGAKITSQIVTGVTGRGTEQADATATAQSTADTAVTAAAKNADTIADVQAGINNQNETISGIQGDITDLTTDLGTVKTTAKEAKDTADEVSETLSTDYSKTGTDTSYVTASTNLQTADEIMSSVSGTYATQETVSTVSDAAAAAQSTADKAQSTAEDAWSRTLRVQVSSSPADATGDTSRLTATVWRGGEQLSDETVAKMGLLAWYVGGSRVATGSTYTCAAGTATECRLEA